MKYALVVGLGGGADAQMAYSYGKMLKDTHDDEIMVCYAVCKSRRTERSLLEVVPHVYQVENHVLTIEELNQVGENGKPIWVGTTLMDATLPREILQYSTVNGVPVMYRCPLIIELALPSKDNPVAHISDDFVTPVFEGLCPDQGWDMVIGVDSGGDVTGGIEDDRDICMLQCLAELVRRQNELSRNLTVCSFDVVVVGLCIDGENTFLEMTEKLDSLQMAIKDVKSASVLRPFLEPVTKGMQANRTPMIVLNALDDLHDGTEAPEDLTSTTDILGLPMSEWILLPPRHHYALDEDKLFKRIAIPKPWASTIVEFDAHLFLRKRQSR